VPKFLLFVLALLFLDRSAPAKPRIAPPAPKPKQEPKPKPKATKEVPAAKSFGGTEQQWIVGRFAQTKAQVEEWNPAARDANDSAAALVAFFAVATSFGVKEMNFNAAHLPAVDAEPFYKQDGREWRAFTDASSGIAGAIHLLETDYVECLNRLRTDPEGARDREHTTWFSCLLDKIPLLRFVTSETDYEKARKRVDGVLFVEEPAAAAESLAPQAVAGVDEQLLEDDDDSGASNRARARIHVEPPA